MLRSRLSAVLIGGVLVAASAPAATAQAQAPEPVTDQDRTFLAAATESSLFEVASGQLAKRRGTAEVKRLGRVLIRDHTVQLEAGAAAAQKLGITGLPTAPNAAAQAILDRLSGLRKRAFDRAFLRAQRTAHEQAINLHTGEGNATGSPTLRALVIGALPVLGMHLAMAEGHGGH